MKTFRFEVTHTDTYIKTIEIEADNEAVARKELDEGLDKEPLSDQKNTFSSTDTEIKLL